MSRCFLRARAGLAVVTLVALSLVSLNTADATSLVLLSGVVRDASGVPVSGVQVVSRGASISTATDGSYVLHVPDNTRGPLGVEYRGSQSGGGWQGYLNQNFPASSEFMVSGDTTVDVTLPGGPPLVRMHVTVVDANGAPVAGVQVFDNFNGVRDVHVAELGSLSNGATLSYTWNAYGKPLPCTTDASGGCDLLGVDGLTLSLQANYDPPGYPGASAQLSATFTGPVTNTTVELVGYAAVESVGQAAGDVVVSVPDGFSLSEVSASPASVIGSSVLVGALAYEVRGMADGGSVDVTLTLPSGAAPTSVFKVDDAGATSDVTSAASITGNVVALHLTDGGFGDQDGVENGVIVDPVIPAVRAALSVSTSSLPSGLVGRAYPSTTLKVVGGRATYVWSVAGRSLPAGLRLSSAGVLSGTPTKPGTSTFTVKVLDGSSPKLSAAKQFTVSVAPMTVATPALPDGHLKKAYSAALLTSGGKGPFTWTLASGALPRGLKLSAAGKLTGTPTKVATSTFTVKVIDSSATENTATKSLTIRILK